VLGRFRLGALGFAIISCLGPLGQLNGDFSAQRRLVSVVAVLLLCVVYLATYVLKRPLLLEPVLVAPLAVLSIYGLQDSLVVIGTCLGVSMTQSLYGSTRQCLLRTACMLPVLPVAVTLTPSLGREVAVLSATVLFNIPLTQLPVPLMRTMRSTQTAQAAISARDAVLASTGRALLGRTNLDEVREIVQSAAVEICRLTPGLVLLVARPQAGSRTIRWSCGTPEPLEGLELAGALGLVEYPGIADAKVGAGGAAELDLLSGLNRAWWTIGLSGDDSVGRGGILVIGLLPKTPLALLDTLGTLVTQLWLAESACRAHSELAQQAHHDDLTGLPNRALLFRRIDDGLRTALRDGSELLLMIVDLDGFKQVNDGLGHAAGDAVLVEVARRMTALLDGGGLVARLGGDEFAVLVPGIDIDSGMRLATALRTWIAEPMQVEQGRVTVGASIGLATADPAMSAEALVGWADIAMYAAKSDPTPPDPAKLDPASSDSQVGIKVFAHLPSRPVTAVPRIPT